VIAVGSGGPGPGSAVPPKCSQQDFDDLVTKGDAYVSSGQHGAGLDRYKQALLCKGDGSVIQKAFLAACNAKNQGEAHNFFMKVPSAKQNYFSQACLRYGIDPTKP